MREGNSTRTSHSMSEALFCIRLQSIYNCTCIASSMDEPYQVLLSPTRAY